jgi:hypothetical protein
MRKISKLISASTKESFRSKGVLYIRNYSPHFDLQWPTVFQTEQKSEVETFCTRNNIRAEWLPDGGLRTTQLCHGVANHPETTEEIFFNQAHLFHRSAIGNDEAQLLSEMLGRDRLPRDAVFGDGSEIPSEMLMEIRAAYEAEAVDISWQAGDIVLLDNMLTAHGRRPYSGDRKVIVGLLDPHIGSTSANGVVSPTT